MKHYFVTTPAFTTYYQDEPPETYPSCVSVTADNVAEAKKKALIELKEWVHHCRLGNINPFVGLIVSDAKCPHGNCYCNKCDGECKICEDEADKAWEQEKLNAEKTQ